MDQETKDPRLYAPLASFAGKAPPAPGWFRHAIEQKPERSFVEVLGAKIETLAWGERGKPGILFMHGNGAHADWWSFIAPFFAAHYRVAAMSWSVTIGMIIGVLSAVWRNRWPDRLGMTLAVSGISFPAFALGMVLMEIFAVQLNWLPTVGADTWKHYILPSLTLGAAVAAIMARFTRSSFVDILQEDYVRTARAKGLSENVVVIKHGLRNALIPVVTMLGLQFGFLLGGSIVVEVVFNWPGMGRLLIDAVDMRDYPVIQTEILLFSLEFILINLIVDVLYAVINPTIRYR